MPMGNKRPDVGPAAIGRALRQDGIVGTGGGTAPLGLNTIPTGTGRRHELDSHYDPADWSIGARRRPRWEWPIDWSSALQRR